MPSSLHPDTQTDLEVADLTFGSKNWDRRRSNHTRDMAVTCLEHAMDYLIEDQMGEHRAFWQGSADAVRLLRETMVAIKSEATLDERAARVAASWLPKYTLARHARRGELDA